MNTINLKDVMKASKNFDKNIIIHTPLEFCESLSKKYEANIRLKREDLQIVRSYKIRGAFNFLNSLNKEQKKLGIVAASAGNHAQGVALVCNHLKIKGSIFMPKTTPSQKVRKTKKFGGEYIEIKLVGDNFNEAYEESTKYCEKNNAIFVHPFDDTQIITGQATIGLEIIEDYHNGNIDYVFLPVGGGGLISGVGTIFKELMPNCKITGVEPDGADSMCKSIQSNKIVELEKVCTIAEGVAVKKVGDKTFNICKGFIDKITLVPDGLTATTMLDMLDDQGIILEGAGALSISALEIMKNEIKGKNIVCILSGGNFDFSKLPEIQEKSLKYQGIKRYFIITFPQRPGALKEFLNTLGKYDDIAYFEYIKKHSKEAGPALIGIESDSKENMTKLIENMTKNNILYEDITDNELLFNFLI